MRALRLAGVVVVLTLAFPAVEVAVGARCAIAQSAAHHASVVIESADGGTREMCVGFDEATITGLELLQRTGLEIAYQDYGGGQVTVCRIDGEGCPYPGKPCFCRCADAARACTFWGYYTLDRASGEWSFADAGAGSVAVRDGDLHGWRWGEHGTTGARPPAAGNSEAICARAIASRATETGVDTRRSGVGLGGVIVLAGALGVWAVRLVRRKGPER